MTLLFLGMLYGFVLGLVWHDKLADLLLRLRAIETAVLEGPKPRPVLEVA